MITSKEDLAFYLSEDKKALGIRRKRPSLFGSEIWKYEILLRKLEYYKNCKSNILLRPYVLYLKYRFHNLGIRLNFEIPLNVCGPGLELPHIGTIIISAKKIGANCKIHSGVNIGKKHGKSPIIGNNVYIGPGAKIFGGIEIADNIAIGANAVVNKSFLEPNITIAGVPAKKLNDKGSGWLLVREEEGDAK
ncbi:serine acetyltransferase [Candidatus Kaiserbacteria bacterium RIFCSPHIGHO2_02_FULL_49_16]|uniref:Serine acetyltransferase n=1 Tax=Candidatus Kaiserbacteria bacterium RIFCSPHIGHO2_02_FULL_49_16 TaxID=1798490 RepID=A0A1F6DD15_9BACT|nr:MAG: serine acetyltransferase [Candidatus Kaiserbacteria bacterium RIFCSPHIGHO2_02_FULL_49_16]